MTDASNPTTRRTILIGAATLAGLPILAAATQAQAAGTMPKANVHFQTTPKGANQCSKCNYFLPGASPTATGKCKIIAGDIVPTGWCTMFAPKHA
jgi:hypothetical protein